MASHMRGLTPYSSTSTSYQTDERSSSSTPMLDAGWISTRRPRTRPRTAASTTHGDQRIICAISESRGISPIVGLAFVNIDSAEAVLCQISDNQTFVRTVQKLTVYKPTEILFMSTAAQPKSKLYLIIETNLPYQLTVVDRKYWSETVGFEYIQQLAFKQDVEAIKVSVGGNFYATCCFAAVLKYVELAIGYHFIHHSLRIKYEASQGSMMVDLSTMNSLEVIQNLQNAKSKDCLYGLLNQTMTPMGARMLKSNVLQPSTDIDTLEGRYDAVAELASKEDLFFAVRQALKGFVDVDRVLTAITVVPTKPSIQYWEQSINNVIMLKQYVKSIPPVFEALSNAESGLLLHIQRLCRPENTVDFQKLIDETINEDITYQTQPLDLRNQRTYAIKSGVNGLLDVARQTYKEVNADAYELVTDMGQKHKLALEMKYDTARQYYIRIPTTELEDRDLPDEFINAYRKKAMVECQTLDLLKLNQKIADSHHEVLQMSDKSIQDLIDEVREDMAPLFKIAEAIAMLDMVSAFAQLVTTKDYCRPELTQTLAIKNGRHPIREIMSEKYVPNDAYATQQTRFQIITGCNMSGKSTYIRSLALMAIMAQTGSFVPASYASFPIFHQLFTRMSMDDSIEANVSTFASEMREMAFILRNVDERSMAIIDELGRGTSTRDGLAIAIAIAEALVDSRALVWFATHFRDLAKILAERNGVVNLHLAVDMGSADKMTMLYKISSGCVQEEHYGLALAKVVDLPPNVIRVAEEVSKTLATNTEKRKKNSKTIAVARWRKLVLSLREQLVQAKGGNMQGVVLGRWLKKLQDEFVIRMAAIDAEVAAAEDDAGISEVGDGSRDGEFEDDGSATPRNGGLRSAHTEETVSVEETGSAGSSGVEITGARQLRSEDS